MLITLLLIGCSSSSNNKTTSTSVDSTNDKTTSSSVDSTNDKITSSSVDSTNDKTSTTSVDTTAPTVSSTIPANSATAVTVNSTVSLTFSEDMDSSTITTFNWSVTDENDNIIIGSVSQVDKTFTFTPTSNLNYDTVYSVIMTTAVTDLANNHLESNYTFSFTTAEELDTTAPTVSSTIPANSAANILVNSDVIINFSETMDETTIIDTYINLRG